MNRTRRVMLATGVALSISIGGVAGSADAAPSGGTATTADTTYVVVNGDALAGIAQRHGIRLGALMRANSLTPESVIHPGDTLIIPAGATIPAPRAATPAPAATVAATPAAAAPGATVYTVQTGDALSRIAWRHGVRLGALLSENSLTMSSLIVPGQQLRVPAPTRPIPVIAPVAPAAPAAPTAGPTTPAIPAAAATAPATTSMQTVLDFATAQVGAPYRFFGAGPDAFDCSGLVVAAFRQVGVTVPHQSRALAKTGTPVDWRTQPIAAGDLVFTSAFDDPERITHVGIALDSRRWVHAVGFGRTVTIATMPSATKIMAVTRITVP